MQELDDLNSKFVSLFIADSQTTLTTQNQANNENIQDIIGIDDMMIIPGYKEYTLDTQIDIGAMSSCCKYKAIPTYYWKPTQIQFRAVNKQLIQISYIAPDSPLLLGATKFL